MRLTIILVIQILSLVMLLLPSTLAVCTTSSHQIRFKEKRLEIDTTSTFTYVMLDVLVGPTTSAMFYLYRGDDDNSFITKYDIDQVHQFTKVGQEKWLEGSAYMSTDESIIWVLGIYTTKAYVISIRPSDGATMKYYFSTDFTAELTHAIKGSMDLTNRAYYYTPQDPGNTVVKFDTQDSTNVEYITVGDVNGVLQSVIAIDNETAFFHFRDNTNKYIQFRVYDFENNTIKFQSQME